MDYELLRLISGPDATSGILYEYADALERKAVCCIVEDEHRDIKVRSETRIPAGKYELKFREMPTPLTTTYRAKYDFFNWHIELQNVPNFKYIYIHAGYTDDSSAGCLICGEMLVNTLIERYKNGWTGGKEDTDSAYKRAYITIRKALKEGKVYLTIKDIG